MRTGRQHTDLGETNATRAPVHITLPAVYSPSGGGNTEMYPEAEFFSGNEGKINSTLVLLHDQQMYWNKRFKWLKNGAEKTTSPVFFQSHWRFEPLSYLRVHITSLSSILPNFIFCIAGHCFYRLTKHCHKTCILSCLLSSLKLLR